MKHSYRIGVFVYDFPHWKSQAGLMNMILNDLTPSLVLAAPWRELSVKRSRTRVQPVGEHLVHPMDVMDKWGKDGSYVVLDHDSTLCVDLIHEYALDYGVVLGARILRPNVIGAFRYGVLNMHPGILPGNRGLDNIKWSLIKQLPIGVTVHWIDERIDAGRVVARREIPVYKDDTLVDLHVRVRNLEQKMMLEVMYAIAEEGVLKNLGSEVEVTPYHLAVPDCLDKQMSFCLHKYVRRYGV